MSTPSKLVSKCNRKRSRVSSVPVKSSKKIKMISHHIISPPNGQHERVWDLGITPTRPPRDHREMDWPPMYISQEEWANIDRLAETYTASAQAPTSTAEPSTATPPATPTEPSTPSPQSSAEPSTVAAVPTTSPAGPSAAASPGGPDHKIRSEQNRLLSERTFHLTKSGNKVVIVGVDPLAYNEPTVKILSRNNVDAVSFSAYEFEDFMTALPMILSKVEDVEARGDDSSYNVIAELSYHDAVMWPNRVVQLKRMSESIHLAEETLKTFSILGIHILTILRELNESERSHPRFHQFAADLAYKVVDEKLDVLSDDKVWEVIGEKYDNNYLVVELFTKFPHSLNQEVTRLVDHMLTYNNYDFY